MKLPVRVICAHPSGPMRYRGLGTGRGMGAEEPYLRMLAHLREPVLLVTNQGTIVGATITAAEALRMPALAGTPLSSHVLEPAAVDARLLETAQAGGVVQLRTQDGRWFSAHPGVLDGDLLLVRLTERAGRGFFPLVPRDQRARGDGSAESLGELARGLLPFGMKSVGAKQAGIFLLDDTGSTLELVGSLGYPEVAITGFRLVAMNAKLPLTDCVRGARSIFLLSSEGFDAQYPGLLDRVPIIRGALVCIPLVENDKCIGALGLGAPAPWELRDTDRELLEVFAGQCAATLARARRADQERVRGDSDLAVARLERLHTFTGALARALTPSDVAEVVVSAGMVATEARSGGLWLVDEDGRTVSLTRSAGPTGPRSELHQRVAIDRPVRMPILDAIRDGAPVWIESCRQLELRYPEIFQVYSTGRESSLVCVPLIAQGRCLGGLALNFASSHQLFEYERAFFEVIAWYAAQAIERARLYAAEQRARAEAARLYLETREDDRLKDEFLAMLSHELRNPLVPIVAAIHLMDIENTAQFERERGLIRRSTQHLVRLVDDLLDISRITRGNIALLKTSCELMDLVREAVDIVFPVIEDRNHRLLINASRHRLAVHADRIRMIQAIANLLTNAAKYTERNGTITVSISGDAETATVSVRDTGIGIAADVLPRVFDIFVQGHAPSRGGLGIGLTIVKRIVELHGGTVSATSAGPAQGSEFVIRLPVIEMPKEVAPTLQPTMRRFTGERRVLVVDDNHDAAEAIGHMMSASGFVPQVTHDGHAALAAAAEVCPDVALIDLGMQGMDGFELARRLRELYPELRLIAVTGFGRASDRTLAGEAGFDEHIIKPVTLDELRRVLAQQGF